MVQRLLWVLILCALLSATGPAAANAKAGGKSATTPGQTGSAKAVPKYTPDTGDKDLDLVLCRLNEEARAQANVFMSELSISYGIPRIQMEDLVYTKKMSFGDVFVSVWLASSMKKPLRVVVNEYETNRDRGWGAAAQSLGLQPGSEAFHTLKRDSAVELELARKRNKEAKAQTPAKTLKSKAKRKAKK